jgi:hypothetical protein
VNRLAFTQGFQQRYAQLEKRALSATALAGILGGAGGAGVGYALSGKELDTASVLRNMALGGIGGGVLGAGGMALGGKLVDEGLNLGRVFLDEQRANVRGDMQALLDHANQRATEQRTATLREANDLASGQRNAADIQLGNRLDPLDSRLAAIERALKAGPR